MEEIKLNDKTYILKEEFEKLEKKLKDTEQIPKEKVGEGKRFSWNHEKKLMTKLEKIFKIADEPVEETILIKENKAITDPSFVCMIWGKTEEAKRLLTRFVDKDCDLRSIPDWSFKSAESIEIFGRYSNEYIKEMIEILTVTDDATSIKLKNDHPMQMENRHFVIVLAPRVEREEEDE